MGLTRMAAKSAVLLVLGAVVLFGAGLAWSAFELPNPFDSQRTDRSQPALLVSIQELSEYHAAVGNFEVVIDVDDNVRWVPDFIAGERSLFVAAGTVDAVIEFSDFSEDGLVLSDDGKSVEIRLPEAKLDKPNLDQSRTYLVTQERGIVNKYEDFFTTQDQSNLYELAEKKFASAASESKLTQQAEENTKDMLKGMFNSIDMKVTFTESSPGE